MSDALSRLLARKDVVLADGAMGTNLFQLGLANGSPGELWNIEHPDLVASVHQGFVDAGSDILLTNTFGANRYRLGLHKLGARAREFNMAAARIARAVADKAERLVVIAGDIGPIGDILAPFGTRTVAEAEEAFFEQAQALKEGGVDIAWIETMIADNELDAAIRGVQRAGLAYVATMTFDTGGRTLMGESPEEAMRRIRTSACKPIAFGANCGVGPAQLMDSVIGLVRGAENDVIVVAKGNCGIPVLDSEMGVRYDGNPEVMGIYACMARDAGARIIGGCCGTTAQHMKSMSDALASRPKGPAPTYDDIQKILGPVKITSKGEIGAGDARSAKRLIPFNHVLHEIRTTMNIWLPPEAASIVREKVDSGLYDSHAQVIQEALILLEERDQTRALRTDRLLTELANGIDQANNRQLVDALEVFRTLRSKAIERVE